MAAGNDALATLIADLMSMPSMLHDGFLKTANYVGVDLQRYIQEEKLEGQVLRHITGKLSGSVRYEVEDRGSEVAVIVSAGGGVAPYAGVHERGGTFTIPEHMSMSARWSRLHGARASGNNVSPARLHAAVP